LNDDEARRHRRANRLAGGPSRFGLTVWKLLSSATRQIRVEVRCHRRRNRLASGPSRLGLAVWKLLSSATRQVRVDEHELRRQRFRRDRFQVVSSRVGWPPSKGGPPGLDVSDVVLREPSAKTAVYGPRDDGLFALAGFLHTVGRNLEIGFHAETLEWAQATSRASRLSNFDTRRLGRHPGGEGSHPFTRRAYLRRENVAQLRCPATNGMSPW